MEDYLNQKQQKILLELARKAIQKYLELKEILDIVPEDKKLKEKRGAFVTLKVHDQLRGCIGYSFPVNPLYITVIKSAISAATEDFRFPSLSLEELSHTKIEISVLTHPHPVKNIQEIEVGTHGIIITKGPNKGLLLPQVAVEWGWDRETFLSHGCLKAGLPDDEWKKEVTIEIFSAQVFSE